MEPSQPNPSPVENFQVNLYGCYCKIRENLKKILLATTVGVVVGIIVSFSIPKEYSVKAIVAPENASNVGTGRLGALASFANLRGASQDNGDALSLGVYPDILSSSSFLSGLFNVSVENADGVRSNLFSYIYRDVRKPWWSEAVTQLMRMPNIVKGLFRSSKNSVRLDSISVDPSRLTGSQMSVVNKLRQRLELLVNYETGTSTLTVMMQDPMVAAQVADTVLSVFQRYIQDYKTNKARTDLVYIQKLYDEAKEDYVATQTKFASFQDNNRNIALQSRLSEQERLRNEMNLAYNVYSNLSQQLTSAKAKVQEDMPVFTIIQPPVVPVTYSKPQMLLLTVAFGILFLLGSLSWHLFMGDFYHDFMNRIKPNKEMKDVKN